MHDQRPGKYTQVVENAGRVLEDQQNRAETFLPNVSSDLCFHASRVPPHRGQFKTNIDAAVHPGAGFVGVGVVIRDSVGV